MFKVTAWPAGTWCACAACVFLGGCNATHVVYVHDATLGIDVHTATEGTAKIAIGYERETFGLVPVYEKTCPGTGEKLHEAMTVTAISRVYAKGLDRVEFGHVVATGRAAADLAKHPGALKNLAQQVFVTKPAEQDQKKVEGGGK